MQVNILKALDLLRPGPAAGVGLAAQAQQEVLGIPLWLFLLAGLLVIIFAVIWVLSEEAEAAQTQEERQPAMAGSLSGQIDTAPAAVVTETVAGESAAQVQPEDLTVIEGIGPKISRILQAANIATLAQLAATEAGRLRQILREAGLSALTDPGTWPEQASLAAAGDWEGLKALQDELKGGRRG